MFIPPQHLPQKASSSLQFQGVWLQAHHLCLDARTMGFWPEAVHNVYMAAYPEKGYILITPVNSPFFRKMHDSSQHMLKDRNLKGDKRLALHELLIDEELDATDRELKHEFLAKSSILKVYLS